ncbi:MAG: cation-translocating P-type ATPase [Magnetococcales bacterium]|nr:cation-translocating P-type ATPase [Magnetococcales bacterium]MBF0117090.1 cation-translocating P-type ATPase [Magnetococcales bacterium]
MSQHASSCCRQAGCSALPQSEPVATAAQRFLLHLPNLCCSSEEAVIRNQLRDTSGIVHLQFDYLQKRLTVHHHDGNLQAILTSLQAIQMPATLIHAPLATAAPVEPLFSWRSGLTMLFAGAAALGAEVLVWSGSDEQSWPIRLLSLLAIVSVGHSTLRKGWQALRLFSFNIHFLMSLAVLGALVIGQWPEAAMVIFLFALSERIEARSLAKARQAVSALLTLAPEEALLQLAPHDWQRTPVAEIQPGAIIRILPGERIPLDGVVVQGHSTVNQAPITGESLPVAKEPGALLYAGTINQLGTLECRVSADRDHTTLARIIATIQEAQAQRAPTQQFIERFARYYTPGVLIFAFLAAVLPPLLGTALWQSALYNALVLLVVACPCALVISTPVTLVSGLTAAARQGILIKGGIHLENGHRLQALAFDKTGTLTQGELVLSDLIPLAGHPAQEILRVAAALESHSEHPLAAAILNAWQGGALPVVSPFKAHPGKGIAGCLEDQSYILGTPRWLEEQGFSLQAWQDRLQALAAQEKTILVLADSQHVVAILAARDQLRPHSVATVAQLQQMGITPFLLTGDGRATAQAIAQQTAITQVHAECLPQQKWEIIKTLLQQYSWVGMVGDGINDGPAMAQASISFAMGQGSATAMESADVVLMQSDLSKIPLFLQLSRATYTVLRQNIGLALFLKGLVFLLALFGLANLWMALFSDVGASLLVIANGLRLLRF